MILSNRDTAGGTFTLVEVTGCSPFPLGAWLRVERRGIANRPTGGLEVFCGLSRSGRRWNRSGKVPPVCLCRRRGAPEDTAGVCAFLKVSAINVGAARRSARGDWLPSELLCCYGTLLQSARRFVLEWTCGAFVRTRSASEMPQKRLPVGKMNPASAAGIALGGQFALPRDSITLRWWANFLAVFLVICPTPGEA